MDIPTKQTFNNPVQCITARCRELGRHVRFCPYYEHVEDCDCLYCGGVSIE